MRNLKQTTLSLTKKLSVLAVSAVLAACAVGPDYQRPKMTSPDEFVSTDPAQFEVVVSLEQRPEMIAGLSLVGTIETDSKKDVVVVPTLAVMRDDEGYYVYVERNGAVEKQPVKIGLETPEKTEVIGGIREGDTVVLQ